MVTLSRYFYENVEIVANMCPICYEECDDVKIISINKAFLEQVRRKSSQNLKIPDWLSFVSQNHQFLGFSPEEGQAAKTHSDAVQTILKNIRDDLRNFEMYHITTNECSVGFSSNDVKNSRPYHERVKKKCNLIRYKISKKISLSIITNIKKRRLKQKSNTAKETVINRRKEYSITEETEVELRLGISKYFSNDNFNNNFIETSEPSESCQLTEIESKYNEDCGFKTENVIVFKSEEMKSGDIFDTGLEHVDYESEYFKIRGYATENIHNTEFSSKFIAGHSWIPPRSPHNLIEERLYHDPWALLAATIFLNKTSCMVARPSVFWFLAENPDPLKVLDKFPKDLEKYFCDLGLQRTRAVQMYRMSYDFLFKNWKKASELYGIGNYGESAFRMFCLGDFSAEPEDRFLKIYKAWYEKLYLKT